MGGGKVFKVCPSMSRHELVPVEHPYNAFKNVEAGSNAKYNFNFWALVTFSSTQREFTKIW